MKTQRVFSTDEPDNAPFAAKIRRNNWRVVRINIAFMFTFVTCAAYVSEISEFGNDFVAFAFRHPGFFGPCIIAVVCYVITKKVRG